MSYVLFSIDNVDDTHTLAKFLRYFDTQVALGKTRGYLEHCIGSYEGSLELSFICTEDDYKNFVVTFGATTYQKSVISIQGYECWSCSYDLLICEYMGTVRATTKKKALKSRGWTYRPNLDSYFVIK